MSREDPMTEIGKLNTKKATQRIDIAVKALSKNTDIFGAYICYLFNECIGASQFPLI